MSLQIIEVKNKKDLKKFIDLPWKIYQNTPNWVPQLKIQMKELLDPKHPFFEVAKIKLFIAEKDGETVGRIAAIINHKYNEFHECKEGHFGLFECINHQETANLLLKEAEKFAKDHQMMTLKGPFDPSTNYQCGLLTKGFDDPPQIMMTYAHPYYQELLDNAGLSKAKDLLAYTLNINTEIPEKIVNICKRAKTNNSLVCRPMSKKNWKQEVAYFKEIYNAAWEKNWGFVPFTDNEFEHMTKELRPLVEEKLALVIEMKNKPVGIILTLPDYNQILKKIPNGKLLPFGIFKLLTGKKHINRARVVLLGIKKEFRHLGLSTLFFIELKEAFKQLPQYKELEMSWILEDNEPMNAPLRLLGANVYKNYRIFEKNI